MYAHSRISTIGSFRFSKHFWCNGMLYFLLALLPCSMSLAQSRSKQKTRLKEGDAVQFQRFQEWIDATVLEISGDNVALEYENNGSFQRIVKPMNQLRFAWMAKAITPMRFWSDESKKFRVKAAAVGLKDGYVLLHKEDGTEVSVPIAKLSKTDQRYLDRAKSTSVPKVPDLVEFQLKNNGWGASWNEAQNLSALDPDPIPSFASVPMKGVGFPQAHFHEDLVFLKPIGGSDGWMVAGTVDPLTRNPSRVVWGALNAASVKKVHFLPPGEKVIAVDAPSQQIVTVGSDRESRLTIWKGNPTSDSLEPQIAWKSVADKWGGSENWCEIVAPNRIIHEWGRRKYICWDTEAQMEAYQLGQESFFGALPVLSPGKRYLAIPEDERCRVLDSATGKTLAALPIEGGKCSGAAFNATGDKLAVLTRGTLAIWSLGSQSPPVTFNANSVGSPFSKAVEWIDDHSLLIGHETLFDTRYELPVWQYTEKVFDVVKEGHGNRVRSILGNKLCYAVEFRGQQDGFIIGAVELPGPKVKETVENIDVKALYIISAGHRVGIRTDCQEHDAKVRDALIRQIKDNGWIHDDSSTTYFEASMGRGKPQSVTYRSQDGQSNGTTVTVTPYFSHLKLIYNGEVAFQANTGTGAPPVMFLLPGQSAQGRVDSMQRPNPDHFANVEIPEKIFDPTKRKGLGKSLISSAGLTPQ